MMATSLAPWLGLSFIAVAFPWMYWIITKVVPEAGRLYGSQQHGYV